MARLLTFFSLWILTTILLAATLGSPRAAAAPSEDTWKRDLKGVAHSKFW